MDTAVDIVKSFVLNQPTRADCDTFSQADMRLRCAKVAASMIEKIQEDGAIDSLMDDLSYTAHEYAPYESGLNLHAQRLEYREVFREWLTEQLKKFQENENANN